MFHANYKKDKTFRSLLSGADITRYSINWNGKQWISYGHWLGAPREKRFFTKPRILVRQIISGDPLRIYAGYTEEELYNAQIAFSLILKDDYSISLKYILAILNSVLLTFYHRYRYLDLSKQTFQKILIQDAKYFPIYLPDLDNKQDKARHDRMVKLVEHMLALNQELAAARTEHDKTALQRQIDATDGQIDKLVYELYGLTEEEIGIVEGS